MSAATRSCQRTEGRTSVRPYFFVLHAEYQRGVSLCAQRAFPVFDFILR